MAGLPHTRSIETIGVVNGVANVLLVPHPGQEVAGPLSELIRPTASPSMRWRSSRAAWTTCSAT